MGGKKKTKWRKLPLEEFTKELPTETKKVPPEDVYQPDLRREESNYTPSNNDRAENIQNYAEPYEYVDSIWYPTSCVLYNPADIGMYSNYVMPVDSCYYYYTVPEVQQMQEYVPVPYQEYTSTLPKDTVYLLLPTTQTVRPSQVVPNVVPEWVNRRRRRRYEGYADYAVIPEKANPPKVEEKERYKKTGQNVNSRRNSGQASNFKTMTSFSETSNFNDNYFVSERNQAHSRSSEIKKSSFENMNTERGPISVKEMGSVPLENNQKRKKSLEVCSIHTKSTKDKKELPRETEQRCLQTHISETPLLFEISAQNANTDEKQKTDGLFINIPLSSECNNPDSRLTDNDLTSKTEETDKNKSTEQFNKTDNKGLSIKEEFCKSSSHDNEMNQETKLPSSSNANVLQHLSKNTMLIPDTKNEGDIDENNSQSSLPDILSTLNKPLESEKVQDVDDVTNSPLPDGEDLDKGKSPKPKSFLTQTSYLPNLLSSEALHNEMEIELRQLKNLHSLQANQSIYKLAYDENVTDQSEADSRSPSPVDPESQVPSSLTSAEILIHEADSGSEAGSEDVELLPHRYESETFLNENKHVYVNKLSLAVELLRTQESLPYDDEFKRVVGENNYSNNIVPIHTGGKVNLGFVDDSCSPNTFSITNNFEKKGTSSSTKLNEAVTQHPLKRSAHSSSDSAIFSDIGFDNLDDEGLCETAEEAEAPTNQNQNNTEEIRAGYRRFGVQVRHYFSPRAALSLNPCLCCIIM